MAEHSRSQRVYTVKTLKDILLKANSWDSIEDDFMGICKCIEESLKEQKSLEKIKPIFKKLEKSWKKVLSYEEYKQTKTNLCNPSYLSKYQQTQLDALEDVGYNRTTRNSNSSMSAPTTPDKTSAKTTANQESVSMVADMIDRLTNELQVEKEKLALLEKEHRALKDHTKKMERETTVLTSHALQLRNKVLPLSEMIDTFQTQWQKFQQVPHKRKKKKKGKRNIPVSLPEVCQFNDEMTASEVITCTGQTLIEMKTIFAKLQEVMGCLNAMRDIESWISTSVDDVKSRNEILSQSASSVTDESSLLRIPAKIRIHMEGFFKDYVGQCNEVSTLRDDIQHIKNEKLELEVRIQEIEKDHDKFETKMISKNTDIKHCISSRDKEIEDLKHQNDQLLHRQEEGRSALLQLKRNMEDVAAQSQEKDNLLQTCKMELSSKVVEIGTLEKRLSAKDTQIEDLKEQTGKLLNRISKQAEVKLKDGNHAITDLSDPNRPINLAEKFSELYDNEWTEAFDEVTETKRKEMKLTDKEAIGLLLQILCDTDEYCRRQTETQWCEILEAVSQQSHDQSPQIPQIYVKDLRNVRKMTSSLSAEGVIKKFFASEFTCTNPKLAEVGKNLEIYIRRCLEICWLMSAQNPPLFLYKDVASNDQFNDDYFKFYTCAGRTVDFLVWPALLNYENGDLLRKGVCQGLKK